MTAGWGCRLRAPVPLNAAPDPIRARAAVPLRLRPHRTRTLSSRLPTEGGPNRGTAERRCPSARAPSPLTALLRSACTHGGQKKEEEPQGVSAPAPAAPGQPSQALRPPRQQERHLLAGPPAAAVPKVAREGQEVGRGPRSVQRGPRCSRPPQERQAAQGSAQGSAPSRLRQGGAVVAPAALLPHGRVGRARDGGGAAQPSQRLPLGEAAGLREGVLFRAAGTRARDAGEAGEAPLQPGQPRGGALRGPEEVGLGPQPRAPALQPGRAQQLHTEASLGRKPGPAQGVRPLKRREVGGAMGAGLCGGAAPGPDPHPCSSHRMARERLRRGPYHGHA